MNFQSLFKEYTPVEYGDFFRLYRINNRGYVIYCNENNVICCMELYGFTDISVIMLAELLKVNLEEMEDCEEFSLPVHCSRQQIIDYLFDVSAKETNVKLKHVSGLHGYLLNLYIRINQGLMPIVTFFNLIPLRELQDFCLTIISAWLQYAQISLVLYISAGILSFSLVWINPVIQTQQDIYLLHLQLC